MAEAACMFEDHVQTLNPKDFHFAIMLRLDLLRFSCDVVTCVDSMDQGLDNGVQFTCRR